MSSPNKCLLCWLYKQELYYRDKRQFTGTVAGVQCQAENFINPELPQKMADFWVWLSFLSLGHLKANFPFPPLTTSWSSWTKFWDKDEIHKGPPKEKQMHSDCVSSEGIQRIGQLMKLEGSGIFFNLCLPTVKPWGSGHVKEADPSDSCWESNLLFNISNSPMGLLPLWNFEVFPSEVQPAHLRV